MKTSALLALLGKVLLDGSSSLAAPGEFSPSLLMLIGLAGLALLTHRSERWRLASH